MTDMDHKTSAQLEREVEAQRSRVKSSIDQIQDRLSPGQMVDELLGYARNNGGGEFVANLGKSVTNNPLPVALLGVSLVWLMAKQGSPAAPASLATARPASAGSEWGAGDGTYGGRLEDGFEYATISGGLRHSGEVTGSAGERYREFTDASGKKFRALSDAAGNRAGNFIDEAGQTFHGFKDAAGERVHDIRSQSGALMETASGWASDTWDATSEAVKGVGARIDDGRQQLQQRAADAGSMIQQQTDQVSKTLLGVLHDQPLVGGALAFAVGAAIGATLPPTVQEDRLLGDAADKLKQQAGGVASEAYEAGKQQAAELYEQVSDKAADLYEQATAEPSDDGGSRAS